MSKPVVLVTNIPTPYRIPLFNTLDRLLKSQGTFLVVVFGAQSYDRRKWIVGMEECEFEYYVLMSESKQNGGNPERVAFSYTGLVRLLSTLAPRVVIAPGYSAATMKIAAWSLLKGFPFVIWSGSVYKRGRFDSPWRRVQRKALAAMASAVVVYGTAAKQYAAQLGVPEQKIFTAINTVDTAFFAARTAEIRSSLPERSTRHLTYIGYLSPRKQVQVLLEALVDLARERDDFLLDVVGDGEDLESLESFVRQNRLSRHVRFHGYQQKDTLPEFLAQSHGFLFQTGFDIWGLVLNEAMAAGVPCIASEHAGASHDLVEEGVTGFRVDFNCRGLLLDRIRWLLENPGEARRMGARAQQFITRHASLDASASGFIRAIRYADPAYTSKVAR